MSGIAEISRKTKETDITVNLKLSPGVIEIDTGIGFFDHMLNSLAFHAGWTLKLGAKGDLGVDSHHTVEDVGIVLGQALRECVGDKAGIARYGEANIPMDEALAFATVDVSGRPYLVYSGDMPQATAGNYDFCLNEEFFRAFVVNSGLTLHVHARYGRNSHHMTEAMFKAVAYALKRALRADGNGVRSTKGEL